MEYFFIRGFWKSGTNWLQNILNTHPEVAVTGEWHWHHVDRAIEAIGDIPHSKLVEFGKLEEFRRLKEGAVKSILLSVLEQEGKISENIRLIGGRTPEPAYPETVRGAKYLIMQRDGRDVLVSGMYHLLNECRKKRYKNDDPVFNELYKKFEQDPYYFKKQPHELLTWENFVKACSYDWARATRENIRFHRDSLSGKASPSLVIKYEDMLKNFEKEMKRVCKFLDIQEFDYRELKGRFGPGFRKEDPTSFYRHGIHGDWYQYFTPDVVRQFGYLASEEISLAGYIW